MTVEAQQRGSGTAIEGTAIVRGISTVGARGVLAGGEVERRQQKNDPDRDRLHDYSGVVALMPSIARRRSHWLGR